jgi:ankyrin repeat protein
MSTPLHIATDNGHYDAVVLLLQAGANINNRDNIGLKPIHLATVNDYRLIVDELLKYGTWVDTATLDIEYDYCSNDTSLHLASMNNHDELALTLIQHGASINHRNSWQRTPLHLAVMTTSYATIKLLLKHGANIHLKDSPLNYEDELSPLGYAMLFKQYGKRMVCLMLRYRKSKRDIHNAIILAVRYDNIAVCKYLLNGKKANPNTMDANGNSLLHIAMSRSTPSYNMINLLRQRSHKRYRKR